MVKSKLVEGLITDGARLLAELDRQAFPVESMFWVLLPDQDYWRLVIGSPVVADQGGMAGYGRLGEILEQMELAGTTLSDISLLDPDSQEFRSLFAVISRSSRLAAGPAWLEFEEAVVYRWTNAAVAGELSCDVSLNELNQIWQDERRLLNLPALLIALERRRVTLRFHPQHGPRKEIDQMRFNFEAALKQARPECRLNWL
jgi:hypothetical protein